MQRAFLEKAEFVYWLYAVIDFATVWKELWLESQRWQAWNGRIERFKIEAIFLYCFPSCLCASLTNVLLLFQHSFQIAYNSK